MKWGWGKQLIHSPLMPTKFLFRFCLIKHSLPAGNTQKWKFNRKAFTEMENVHVVLPSPYEMVLLTKFSKRVVGIAVAIKQSKVLWKLPESVPWQYQKGKNHQNCIKMIPWWYLNCIGDDSWCFVNTSNTNWYQVC